MRICMLLAVLAVVCAVAADPPGVEKIIYVGVDESLRPQLFLVNPDGTGHEQLTSETNGAEEPAVSPDGMSIAYTTAQDGHRVVMVRDVLSGSARRVSPAGAAYREAMPAFLADGRLSVVSYEDGHPRRRTMRADGGERNALVTSPVLAVPTFASASGTRIAVRKPEGLIVSAADGSGARVLVTRAEHAVFSADGAQVAFDCQAAGGWNIFIADAAVGRPRALTYDENCNYGPAFSPDGKRVVYACFTIEPAASRNRLCTIPSAGGKATIVLDNLARRPLSPCWARLAGPPALTPPVPPYDPFWTTLLAPRTPRPEAPAAGATRVAVPATCAWSAVPDATRYHLQVSERSDFAVTVFDDATLIDARKPLADLLPGVAYYWRVASGNKAAESAWCATQRFTTIPPPSRPDLAARLNTATGWVGQGLYGVAATVADVAEPGGSAAYVVRLANLAPYEDTWFLTAPAAPVGWRATYLDAAGEDVTRNVIGDGWEVSLPADGALTFRVMVTAMSPTAEPWSLVLRAAHPADAAQYDTVTLYTRAGKMGTVPGPGATRGPARPDISVARPDSTGFIGQGVFGNPEQQSRRLYSLPGVPVGCTVRVANVGGEAGVFRVTAPPALLPWAASFSDAGGRDVTDEVGGEGLALRLGAGEYATLTVWVTPPGGSSGPASFRSLRLEVTAADAGNPALSDAALLNVAVVPLANLL